MPRSANDEINYNNVDMLLRKLATLEYKTTEKEIILKKITKKKVKYAKK